jgi:hypothetical protein
MNAISPSSGIKESCEFVQKNEFTPKLLND